MTTSLEAHQHEWRETEVACEDCGTHQAVICDGCEALYDLVYQDDPRDTA